jgi:hypothetical protein
MLKAGNAAETKMPRCPIVGIDEIDDALTDPLQSLRVRAGGRSSKNGQDASSTATVVNVQRCTGFLSAQPFYVFCQPNIVDLGQLVDRRFWFNCA